MRTDPEVRRAAPFPESANVLTLCPMTSESYWGVYQRS
jgi:hypothetical protein